MIGKLNYIIIQLYILFFFFRMFYNDDSVYNPATIEGGITLCCKYGVGQVLLPSANYLLYRENYENRSLYFITYGSGGNMVYFDNSYCFGFNFTLLVVRVDDNKFVTYVKPTANCSDPSHSVISENNLLTVNVTNITNKKGDVDESDRYIVFRKYQAENSSVVVSRVKFFIFNKFILKNYDNITVKNCINVNTGIVYLYTILLL